MSVEVGAASELEELLEGDLSTAATTVSGATVARCDLNHMHCPLI